MYAQHYKSDDELEFFKELVYLKKFYIGIVAPTQSYMFMFQDIQHPKALYRTILKIPGLIHGTEVLFDFPDLFSITKKVGNLNGISTL